MKKAGLVTALVLGAALASALPCWAQFQRYDYVWARRTAGTFTLDGKLNEPQWAQAESLIIDNHVIGAIPGSGYKQEAGFPPTDPNHTCFKFLTTADNQLWIGATVRDSSIGGSEIFNYFDGLLMALKQHDLPDRPSLAGEHLISWWWPVETGDLTPRAINKPMSMAGRWRTTGFAPTPAQLLAWDAAWTVNGIVNSDTLADGMYTVEMRFDLGSDGYNINQAGGDAVEWNCSVYDNDHYWPMSNPFRWSVNRTWIEGPWGNVGWYSDVKILGRSDVTTASGALPVYGPDLVIRNAQGWAAPVIDGNLNERIWAYADSLHIKWGDSAIRNAYPGTGQWRSGQYQPTVNAGTAGVQDPADATVKYFFQGTTLYLGFDVRDAFVQYSDNLDRYDGAIISINDRTQRFSDNNLLSHRLTFQVGPTGNLVAHDELPYLRDTLHAVTCNVHLNPGTTVDTLGDNFDNGYQAEFAIDLTKFGYAADLGDHALYFGIDLLDGDSFTPFSDSYGTRTWFFRQYENEDGPCVAFLNPALNVTAVDSPPLPSAPGRLELLGNYPNPFRASTMLRYRLPQAANVTLDVFDLQGRLVSSRAVGVQPAGLASVHVPQFSSQSGVYLYRLHVTDPNSGTSLGTLAGKMMILL